MTKPPLRDQVSLLSSRSPDPQAEYYAVTFLAKEDGKLEWSCYSHWEGFTDEDCRVEIRSASLVKADKIALLWREQTGQSCLVIDTVEEMEIFFLFGGNALIERTVAELSIEEWLGPHSVVPSGPVGFVHIESIPSSALNRAPTPKLRMQILKRDEYRCRICGRRPDDHVDVELHVHHIRPWGKGGITDGANLITLCHTCHKGLEPHYEIQLFNLLVSPEDLSQVPARNRKYLEGVKRYRELVLKKTST